MSSIVQEKLFREEEKIKEDVYKTFASMSKQASSSVISKSNYVDSGAYDDKEGFMAYSQLSDAQKRKHKIEILIGKLYDKPYFSHIEVSYEDNENEIEHYFLSDCETLDETVQIDDSGFLLPFKQDSKRPISKALFHCYQAKKGYPISYDAPMGKIVFAPKLICDTNIEKRKLLNVIQLYPTPEEAQVTADEILENKLQENRDNPSLQNIISTLQLQQYEIIETDVRKSFIVQGCAGSGKSQCLLHRLFFLRDELTQEGWDKVLLITPTKLFRQYSSELMRRYQLSSIYNCAISDIYRRCLSIYDDRFKERQYIYQMTEEYLPDGYLHAVYDENNVQQIETEIENAIFKYVQSGCDALGVKSPELITTEAIEKIVKQLDSEIKAFDAREEALQQNESYKEKRKEYIQLLKNIDTTKKKLKRYEDELARNISSQVKLKKCISEVNKYEQERVEWNSEREKRIGDAISELETVSMKFDRGTDILAPAKYAKQLYIVKDLTEGDQFKSDEEELEILDELVQIAYADLQEITNDKKPKSILDRYTKRQIEIKNNIDELTNSIEEMTSTVEGYANWLRKIANEFDGEKAKNTLLRSEMQQSRYFLSRIESTVFEQEVWKALTPIKEQFAIKTLEIEETKEGKRRESKILYKSDLLFYIRIYMRLHPNQKLLEYNLICIDEGQDLHRADYDTIHALFPQATINVFGDVDQVLHSACGISDWKIQTGIDKVFPLTTNYRNTAAIVDFCNKKFGVDMEYFGDIVEKQKPIVISNKVEALALLREKEITIITKDKPAYLELCEEIGLEEQDYSYLDTMSDKPEIAIKECYSVFAAKGLEFSNVFVYAKHMTKNQRVVACTRAMGGLYYYE